MFKVLFFAVFWIGLSAGCVSAPTPTLTPIPLIDHAVTAPIERDPAIPDLPFPDNPRPDSMRYSDALWAWGYSSMA